MRSQLQIGRRFSIGIGLVAVGLGILPLVGQAAVDSGETQHAAVIESSALELATARRDDDAREGPAQRRAISKRKRRSGSADPPPPRLPRRFYWKGRYVVPDLVDQSTGKLGIVVPFVWFGRNGNIQMIAGGPKHPIYFTNYIRNNRLYSYTYKWPGLVPRPQAKNAPLFRLSLNDFNDFLRTSRFAGTEILDGKTRRRVNHFRASIVLPTLPSGNYFRVPILLGDFYVDPKDPTLFRQILHFGYHNLYDPELDEWIILDQFSRRGGRFVYPVLPASL